jgi:hypothetical protein
MAPGLRSRRHSKTKVKPLPEKRLVRFACSMVPGTGKSSDHAPGLANWLAFSGCPERFYPSPHVN